VSTAPIPLRLEPLFTPLAVGPMDLSSRIVVSSMERAFADRDGLVTDRMVEHYEAVARGGPALVTVESAFIHPTGLNRLHQLGIHDDACIPDLERLVEALHRHGAKATIQLQHAGPNSRSSVTGLQPLAPSAIATAYGDLSHALRLDEIAALVGWYVDAAVRAAQAGFDGVELHSAHGYLPQAFLSPLTNERTDGYGGSLANRGRFGVEVVKALRDALGSSVAIGCRFSVEELLPGGLTVADTREYARALAAAGCDYLSVSAGTHASFKYVIPPMDVPEGWLLPRAREIREVVGIPVVGAGRITRPELAAGAVARGDVDLVAMGRAFLADPAWPTKARAGRLDEIVSCIGCNQGCMGRVKDGRDVTCLVSPSTGREAEFALSRAVSVKRVVVVGGGPAGMELARVAAERGHEVVLLERERQLGGLAALAGLLPYRQGWTTFAREAQRRVERAGVRLRVGVDVGEAEIGELGPDILVVATGARYEVPELAGVTMLDAAGVLQAGRVPGEHVLVVGRDASALGLCEWLLADGARVTMVSEAADVADPFEQLGLLGRLHASQGFELHTERTLRELRPDGALIALSGAIAPLRAEVVEGVDAVVYADERRGDDGLAVRARLLGLAPDVRVIGDCARPRGALEAILDGATLGRSL
jgi:2,4-dienoyl-CoA reductase-like NADH-dependent reductase (Old Yellow Enzyme family)/thioredoxin reductase